MRRGQRTLVITVLATTFAGLGGVAANADDGPSQWHSVGAQDQEADQPQDEEGASARSPYACNNWVSSDGSTVETASQLVNGILVQRNRSIKVSPRQVEHVAEYIKTGGPKARLTLYRRYYDPPSMGSTATAYRYGTYTYYKGDSHYGLSKPRVAKEAGLMAVLKSPSTGKKWITPKTCVSYNW